MIKRRKKQGWNLGLKYPPWGKNSMMDSKHIEALLVGRSRVQRQQMLNAVELLVLSMRTLMPGEWSVPRG
jgi:hypothetical protein